MTEATVMARRAPSISIRRAWFRQDVLGSLWFLPLCMLLAGLVVSRITLAVDHGWGRHWSASQLMPGDAGALADTAGVVAAAMLTFLGLVLSATLIAVQLASSQYSPRIVRIFVHSNLTKVTMGMFLATFVFAVDAMVGIQRGNRPSAPVLTVAITYLMVIATLVVFAFYLHGIVRLLRVQYLLARTRHDAHEVLDREFPPADAYSRAPAPPADGARRDVNYTGSGCTLQAIDVGGLAAGAEAAGCWVELRVAVGDHLTPGLPLVTVHGDGGDSLTEAVVLPHLLVGQVRTLEQDPAFGIRQLVDIASRALSPAINDPTTAVQAINNIVDLLARIVGRPDPTGWYTSDTGVVRVRLLDDSFARLATLGLTEVLRYGADAPQVTRRLAAAHDQLDALLGDAEGNAGRRRLVVELRSRFERAVGDAVPPAFADLATRPDRMGLG